MLPEGSSLVKKLPVYIVLIALLLAVVAAIFSLWSNKEYVLGRFGMGPEIAAKAGGETFKLETVEKLAADCGLEQKKAAELLVDEKVLTSWASDESVVISKTEQRDEEIRISGAPATDRCVSLQAKVNLLHERLSQNIEKFREGKFIVANFAASKADRSYANKLIDSVYSDLKARGLTLEQAVAKVRKDPRLGVKSTGYASDTQGGSFTADDYIKQHGLLSSEAVRKKVDGLSAGQFSEPFLNQAYTGLGEKDGKLVDVRWVIVGVDRVNEGFSGTVEQLLARTKAKYGAKIYL